MKERWPAARLSAVDAVPLQEDLVATARGPLHLLLVAVGLVLLVACVNVANLVLARATGRIHEFAVRSALGSGSRRLVRQMLVESLVLASLGGLMGLALAVVTVTGLQVLGRDAIPRLDEVGFDPVVLGFAALVTLATAVGVRRRAGAAFRSHLSRRCPSSAIPRDGDTRAGTASQRTGGRAARARADTADRRRRAAGELPSSAAGGPRVSRRRCPDVRREPSERSLRCGAARCLSRGAGPPASDHSRGDGGGRDFLSSSHWTAITAGIPPSSAVPRAGTSVARRDGFNIQQRTVSGDIFAALEIPVLAGRTFDARDDASAPLARRGERQLCSSGVSGHAASTASSGSGLRRAAARRSRSSASWATSRSTSTERRRSSSITPIVSSRTTATGRSHTSSQPSFHPSGFSPTCGLRSPVLDPELVVHRAAPMTEVVGRGTRRERFALVLMGAFAGVSLLLADSWSVRCARLRRAPAHAGDRDPDRPRCNRRADTPERVAASQRRPRSGPAGRDSRCTGARALADVARFWNQSLGPANLSGRGSAADDDGPARGVAARTARLESGAKNRDAGS